MFYVMFFQAVANGYAADRWGYGIPSAYSNVKSWFSPTGSYLQFLPDEMTYECDSTASLTLVYTTNEEINADLAIVVSYCFPRKHQALARF